MTGRKWRNEAASIFLAVLWVAGLAWGAAAAPQADPFYVKLLNKAQRAFAVGKYADAAQQFEIAAFGLSQDPPGQAKAFIYLGLSYYYLKDMNKSESYLRQAVDLLGEKGAASLDIPETITPDLKKLLGVFDMQLALPGKPAAPAPPLTQEDDTQTLKAQPAAPPKSPDPDSQKGPKAQGKPDSAPASTLDQVKEGDIVALEFVDTPPVATLRIPPVYPSSGAGQRIEGTVTVKALISEKGNVIKVEIVKGISAAGFNQAALRAVRRWEFEPASVKGIKVKVWLPISVEFKAQP